MLFSGIPHLGIFACGHIAKMAIRSSCSHPILVGMVQFFLTGLRYYSPKTYQKRKVIWDAPCPVQSRDHTCTSCFHSWWISTRYTFTLAPYSSTEKFFRLDTSLNWSSALHWSLQTRVMLWVAASRKRDMNCYWWSCARGRPGGVKVADGPAQVRRGSQNFFCKPAHLYIFQKKKNPPTRI